MTLEERIETAKEKELNDCKAELNITYYALTLSCDHIAREHNLLFSIFGEAINNSIKDYFVRNARMLLKIKGLTENDRLQKEREE